MKKVFLFLFLLSIFYFTSCAGTPEQAPELTDVPYAEEDYDLYEEEIELPLGEYPPEEELAEELFEEELPEEEVFETEYFHEDEDDAVEDRLTSIEETLSSIEEQLAAILQAIASAQVPPPAQPLEQEDFVGEPEPPALEPEPLPQEEPEILALPELPVPLAAAEEQEEADILPVQPPVSLYQPLPEIALPEIEPQRELPLPPPLSALREIPHVPPLTPVVPQELLDDEIVFSRIVRMTTGQILEVPFRGNGWVFLGELASRRGLVFNSRRLDPEGVSFIFNAETAGTYVLKFFRRDFIRDYILNDHVQVIVGEAPAVTSGWFNPAVDRGRVVAQPRWPTALDEAAIQRGHQPGVPRITEPIIVEPFPVQPETDEQPATDEPIILMPPQVVPEMPAEMEAPVLIPPDNLFERARELFDAGNVAAAIALLDQFRDSFPFGNDELYWLYGQFFEANTPSRNILLALDFYRRLVREFPQSIHFNNARRRIAHLERFFIHIN